MRTLKQNPFFYGLACMSVFIFAACGIWSIADDMWSGGRPVRDLNDSTQAQIDEIERHLHNVERWMPNDMTFFTATAGNDTWGQWLTVLAPSDTPIITGKTKYDPHELEVVGVDTSALTRMELGWGEEDTIVSGDRFSEIVFYPTGVGANVSAEPIPVLMRRIDAGTTLSARVWVDGTSGDEIDFLIGVHEYDQ